MHGRYPCALCESVTYTRYGFRMHMWRMHNYKSKTHALPGTTDPLFPSGRLRRKG